MKTREQILEQIEVLKSDIEELTKQKNQSESFTLYEVFQNEIIIKSNEALALYWVIND